MSSIYAVPLVIVYPVFTAWVGIGTESKIIFGGIYGFFPMLLATAAGVQTIDGSYLLAARSMGATRAQLIRHIMIPAALPSIISGIRIGSAMTTIGVVVAEMMAATAGIGFLITQNRTMFNTAEVYFGVFLVLLLAGAIDWAVRIIEAKAGVRHTRKVQAL
jgi:NitT/TauT family transport system permease protein/taurine transport system permease protein